MKILLVVNASASSVTARARVVIQKALAADHEVTLAETRRRGHATKLAQGAAADAFGAVVVLGGDGTLNEAANGLAGSATALGVLPGGSTNVFARTIGMTNDPIEATGELLSALADDSIRSVNLGSVNGRYFLFHLGVGYDAEVVHRVERRGVLKRYAGAVLFLAAAVTTWSRHYDRSRPRFSLAMTTREGNVRRIDDATFALLLKTSPYTYLGKRSLDLFPDAGLDTGLSCLTFRSLDLSVLLPVVTAALRGRRIESRASSSPPTEDDDGHAGLGTGGQRRRRPVLVSEVWSAELHGYGSVPYQVDGDYLGQSDHLDIRCEAGALRLIVP